MRGGHNTKGKREADMLKQISTTMLKKYGYFSGLGSRVVTWTNQMTGVQSSISVGVTMRGAGGAVRLVYNVTDRVTGEKQHLDYQIPLTSTPFAYGGRRYWFICPWDTDGQHCGRRVGTLYLLGNRFACRHCNKLTYASRNAPPYDKGFVSIPDIERQKDRVKRTHYAGRLTKQYVRLLLMEERFAKGMQALARALGVELPT